MKSNQSMDINEIWQQLKTAETRNHELSKNLEVSSSELDALTQRYNQLELENSSLLNDMSQIKEAVRQDKVLDQIKFESERKQQSTVATSQFGDAQDVGYS